jgi:flap endonuclease-1
VYAAGSEDMDTLTFNSPILLRHLTFSEAKKMPISEINLSVALEDLKMSMSQVRWSRRSFWYVTEADQTVH